MRLSFAVFVAAVAACASGEVTTTAHTPFGSVVGLQHPNGVFTFRGVPYAKPPTQQRRFADPELIDPWHDAVNATTLTAMCPQSTCDPARVNYNYMTCQPEGRMSEDCLHLNVFTKTLNKTAALPVIVFIHGGDFVGGTAMCRMYDPTDFLLHNDVVFVTMNYRLGVLGGLFTGTTRGNYQTKDQRMALTWIQKAIASFGGDPNSITLSGQSSGAFSVGVHLSSPNSAGLFHKAIIASDPFGLLAATPSTAMQLGVKVLESVGCNAGLGGGGAAELECLRRQPVSAFLRANGVRFGDNPAMLLSTLMRWVPVVDGHGELPYQPVTALHEGKITRVPVFMGTVANESVEFVDNIATGPLSYLDYVLLLDLVLGVNASSQVQKIYGAPPASMRYDVRPFLDVIVTDYLFYCPTRWAAAGLTKVTPTFVWFFDFLSRINKWVYKLELPECVHEVCHAQDLGFIFNAFETLDPRPAGLPQLSEEGKVLSRVMQGAWANFARTGNPNPLPFPKGRGGNSHGDVIFPQYNMHRNVLVNYSSPMSMLHGYRDQYCDLWDALGYIRG